MFSNNTDYMKNEDKMYIKPIKKDFMKNKYDNFDSKNNKYNLDEKIQKRSIIEKIEKLQEQKDKYIDRLSECQGSTDIYVLI